MNGKYKVAVVGATGAVGRQLLAILKERDFPVAELVPFASPRSEGVIIPFGGVDYRCQILKKGCFNGVRYAFFDASDAVSREWVPEAAESGAWVVDNSASFRMDEDIPLVVPEINGELLRDQASSGVTGSARERIVAGPNCSTVQMVLALKPLRDRWGLKRVVASTYQSTSGAGVAAMDELAAQSEAVLKGGQVRPEAFPHRIAFNCIPRVGGLKADGYTGEEQKIIQESRKILSLPDLKITATAVRVPTFACHGESLNIECERAFELSEVREALASQPGIQVRDLPEKNIYPLGESFEGDVVEGARGRDGVYIGRIRRDTTVENGLNLWVVSDNLRKGAALNAVQIGETLLSLRRS